MTDEAHVTQIQTNLQLFVDTLVLLCLRLTIQLSIVGFNIWQINTYKVEIQLCRLWDGQTESTITLSCLTVQHGKKDLIEESSNKI